MIVGLIFAGICYGYKSERDFSHCYPNIKANLIDPLNEKHKVINYVMTYEDTRLNEVVDLLNPVKIFSVPFENSRQNSTRAMAIPLVENEDIDFYIMTRFDVHYNKSLKYFNIDWSKFNFTSKEGNGFWESQRFVGDTFYAWPKRLHEKVKEGFIELQKYDPNHMHNFYSILSTIMSPDDIHFMSDEPQLSGHLLTSICTRDYVDRLRGKIPIHQEVLDRFN